MATRSLKVYIYGEPKFGRGSMEADITRLNHVVVTNHEEANVALVIIERATYGDALQWVSSLWSTQPETSVIFIEYNYPYLIIGSTSIFQHPHLTKNLLEEPLAYASAQLRT